MKSSIVWPGNKRPDLALWSYEGDLQGLDVIPAFDDPKNPEIDEDAIRMMARSRIADICSQIRIKNGDGSASEILDLIRSTAIRSRIKRMR